MRGRSGRKLTVIFLTTDCRLGDCVQGALFWATGALRLVIYEGQEAPAGGRSGARRVAVAAADLAAADVVRDSRVAVGLMPAMHVSCD